MDINRFVNARTNTLVETVNQGDGYVTIVTVRGDGYGRKRRVDADAFHSHYLDSSGRPHRTGYIPVNTLPGDHPHAMNTEVSDMDLIDHLDDLSNDELADLILRQQAIAKDAEALIDKAKAVVKSREKTGGIRVYGDTAVVLTRTEKFDGPTAQKNLSASDYHLICVPKPDAKAARALFANDPEKLKLCLKDAGWTLAVRKATDKDRAEAEAQAAAQGDVEVFDGFEDLLG